MDERTLTALKGSIVKWERIVAGLGSDMGPLNCPLCLLFNTTEQQFAGVQCAGCPVADAAGEDGCGNTPYDEVEMCEVDYGTGSPEYKSAAQAELDFLRSLLPADAT